MQMYQTHAPLQ